MLFLLICFVQNAGWVLKNRESESLNFWGIYSRYCEEGKIRFSIDSIYLVLFFSQDLNMKFDKISKNLSIIDLSKSKKKYDYILNY